MTKEQLIEFQNQASKLSPNTYRQHMKEIARLALVGWEQENFMQKEPDGGYAVLHDVLVDDASR